MKLTKDECWFLSWYIENASLDIPREYCQPDEKKMAAALLRCLNKIAENTYDKRRESKSGRVKMDTIDDCIKRLTKKIHTIKNKLCLLETKSATRSELKFPKF